MNILLFLNYELLFLFFINVKGNKNQRTKVLIGLFLWNNISSSNHDVGNKSYFSLRISTHFSS